VDKGIPSRDQGAGDKRMIVVFEIAGVLIFAVVLLAEAIHAYLTIREEVKKT